MQHYRFVANSPGVVFVKSVGLAAERVINLLKDTSWAPSSHQLPPMIVPWGFQLSGSFTYEKIKKGVLPS